MNGNTQPDRPAESHLSVLVANVHKKYRGQEQPVLNGISFTVTKGETVGIVGPNGAGKTTLMLCLLGLQKPDVGTIAILDRKPDDLQVRRRTGYLPERLNFEPWLSGREFIHYHWQLAGCDPSTVRQGAAEMLSACGLPEATWDRSVRTYSRGMLQRLGIAQSMIGDPEILFLDEPTSGIDPPGAMEILDSIRQHKEQARTILINSHQLDHLERVCDRVIFVKGGKVEATEDLRRQTESRYLLHVRWLEPAEAQTGNAPAFDLAALAQETSASLLWLGDCQAKFQVAGDAGAERLIKTLTSAGLPMFMAKPDSRLESFFKTGGDKCQTS